MSADEEKAKGNAAFQSGQYEQAVMHFTKAIELAPTHVLFSNRSGAYCGMKKYEEALADASKCIEMKGDWGKVRCGAELAITG